MTFTEATRAGLYGNRIPEHFSPGKGFQAHQVLPILVVASAFVHSWLGHHPCGSGGSCCDFTHSSRRDGGQGGWEESTNCDSSEIMFCFFLKKRSLPCLHLCFVTWLITGHHFYSTLLQTVKPAPILLGPRSAYMAGQAKPLL